VRLVRAHVPAGLLPAKIDSYGRPVAPTSARNAIGANAYLLVRDESPEVELSLHPADTLGRAKAFYPRHNAQAGVRKLCSLPGWEVRLHCPFGL